MPNSAEELRIRLANELATKAGLSSEQAKACAAAASGDEGYVDGVAEAFLAAGAYQPRPDETGSMVRLEQLEALPAEPGVVDVLDRCRANERSSLEEVRLARLYDLAGQEEKAASCFRTALARSEPLPLVLAVEVAEAAARGGRVALTLAAIDWVAECLLTHDEVSEGPRSEDPVRKDPLSMGSLLERCANVALATGQAPRAVALGKAALNVYERVGRSERVRGCFALLARASSASGKHKNALAAAKQLRTRAQRDGAVLDEALAMRLVAERMEETGKLKEARQLHEQAAKLLLGAGEQEAALEPIRQRARLAVQAGRHEQARSFLEEAAKQLSKSPRLALSLRSEIAELDLSLARLDRVLGVGDKLRKGWESLGEKRLAARAVVLQAWALVLAGDAERARKALGRCALEVDDWQTAGRALRVRAALAEVADQPGEARGLLVDAARSLREGGAIAEAGEALLRRAEIALDEGDFDGCKVDLKRCREVVGGAMNPELRVRAEILRARLSTDLDEREILLEEALGLAETEGLLYDRALATAAQAVHHQQAGDVEQAQSTLTPVMRDLVAVRDALPEPLREGFRGSPLIRQLLAIGKSLEG